MEPGKQLIQPPTERQRGKRRQQGSELTLNLGERQFSGALEQPAFLLARMEPGPLRISAKYNDAKELDRVVLTALSAETEASKRFVKFEKRQPGGGVNLDLGGDGGRTFVPVGSRRTGTGARLVRNCFEGRMGIFRPRLS